MLIFLLTKTEIFYQNIIKNCLNCVNLIRIFFIVIKNYKQISSFLEKKSKIKLYFNKLK